MQKAVIVVVSSVRDKRQEEKEEWDSSIARIEVWGWMSFGEAL